MKFVNKQKDILEECKDIVYMHDYLTTCSEKIHSIENRMNDLQQIMNDIDIARDTISTYGLTECVIDALNGTNNAFVETMACEGIGINLDHIDDYKDKVLSVLDKNYEAAQEGFMSAITDFIKKIVDWIMGLFSVNKRMLTLFEKAAKTYNASWIDDKSFAEINISKGFDVKSFGAIGSVIVKYDSMVKPFFPQIKGILNVFISIGAAGAGDEKTQKSLNMMINVLDSIGKGLKGLAQVTPKGFITTGEDATTFEYDYSVVTKSDSTAGALGFNPKILDGCIDNSKDVLIAVNRYSSEVKNASGLYNRLFEQNSKDVSQPPHLLRQSKAISDSFRLFAKGTQFISTGSNIMSRQVYTMLKQAKISEDKKAEAAKSVDASEMPSTFGQLLLPA